MAVFFIEEKMNRLLSTLLKLKKMLDTVPEPLNSLAIPVDSFHGKVTGRVHFLKKETQIIHKKWTVRWGEYDYELHDQMISETVRFLDVIKNCPSKDEISIIKRRFQDSDHKKLEVRLNIFSEGIDEIFKHYSKIFDESKSFLKLMSKFTYYIYHVSEEIVTYKEERHKQDMKFEEKQSQDQKLQDVLSGKWLADNSGYPESFVKGLEDAAEIGAQRTSNCTFF